MMQPLDLFPTKCKTQWVKLIYTSSGYYRSFPPCPLRNCVCVCIYELLIRLVCHAHILQTKNLTLKNIVQKTPHISLTLHFCYWEIANHSTKLRFRSKAELRLDSSPHLYSVIPQLPLPLLAVSLSPRGACLFLPSGCKTEAWACHERAHTQQEEIKGHRDISSASDHTICATFF